MKRRGHRGPSGETEPLDLTNSGKHQYGAAEAAATGAKPSPDAMSSSGKRVLVIGGGIGGATVLTYLLDALGDDADLSDVVVELVDAGPELGSLTSKGPASLFLANNIPRFPKVVVTEAMHGIVIPSCCSAPCSFFAHACKWLGLGCSIACEKCSASCCRKKVFGGEVSKAETTEALEELMAKHPELQPFDKHTNGVLFVIRRGWYLQKLRVWQEDPAHPERLERYDILTPEEAREREPCLKGEDMIGAVLSKHDGHIECEQMIAAMAKAATERGAIIRTGTRVVKIDRRGNNQPEVTIVKDSEGTPIVRRYSAVVLCTGPQSGHLLPEAPLHPVGGFSITGKVDESIPAPRGALVWPEEIMYMRPSGSGTNPQEYRIGGLMSLTALADMRFDSAALGYFGRTAAGKALIDTGNFDTWTGARPVTVAMPVASEVAPRIFANTGYGPNGFLLCWGASRRVAASVVKRLREGRDVVKQPRKVTMV
eukprot:CAMPEP_0182925576 /NCGR_PEP_ID=MMETSP0105_2-20130417/9484_1 /TAXON_ID=81532 ORGANISM="Acanthoeca-like sp., Strain 10tr" /NCGR_SAMPLE_ID=MMETSP0105_2 /ASSEMBLY_ACC=CAM_ASM_000205 /LENGTH=482 /DNA_ID=CAMNT_0025063429 /DNA_START=53 /DNA_END=1501 /DNA_ORIENTATION=-